MGMLPFAKKKKKGMFQKLHKALLEARLEKEINVEQGGAIVTLLEKGS